jgi:hypothetical protein
MSLHLLFSCSDEIVDLLSGADIKYPRFTKIALVPDKSPIEYSDR